MSGTVHTFTEFCIASLHSLFLWALPRCLLRTLCNTFPISRPSPPFGALCCFVLHERHSAHIHRILLCFSPLPLTLSLGPSTLSIAYVMPSCISCNTFRISCPSPPFCALCCFVQHERHSAHIHRILLCFSPLTVSVGPATLSIAYVIPSCICCNTYRISAPCQPSFCALCCFLPHERHSGHIHRILLCFSPLALTLSVHAATLNPVNCARCAFLHLLQYISIFHPLPSVLCTVLLCAA